MPCPPPGDLPNPGLEPVSPKLRGGFFTTEPPRKAHAQCYEGLNELFCVKYLACNKYSHNVSCSKCFLLEMMRLREVTCLAHGHTSSRKLSLELKIVSLQSCCSSLCICRSQENLRAPAEGPRRIVAITPIILITTASAPYFVVALYRFHNVLAFYLISSSQNSDSHCINTNKKTAIGRECWLIQDCSLLVGE